MAADDRLTVIVIFHNMRREAARTLYTLSPAYQRGVTAGQYEVIAVDHGSDKPLERSLVEGCGDNFRYHYHSSDSLSPVAAINQQAELSRSSRLMVMIDGAHMLTPGVIAKALKLFAAYDDPFISVVGFHLGPGIQNATVSQGYDQQAEDRLLESVDWRRNGYELFRLGQGLSYDCAGWFGPLMESNCFLVRRETFLAVGGFDEGFQEPGGGLAILDIFRRLVEDPGRPFAVLLGEGSFHQFHGGVASNAPFSEHPWTRFAAEYERLRGRPFEILVRRPLLFGEIPPEAVAWTKLCAQVGLDWWEQRDRYGEQVTPDTFGYAMQAARESQAEPDAGEIRQRLFALQREYDRLEAQYRVLAAERERGRNTLCGRLRRWFKRGES